MLQIRLLGQFDVRVDGKRATIPSRAGQSLFAYLVLTAGTPHRREKLAGTFWPDITDENARRNLRQELWRIRKVISAQQSAEGDYLLADEFTLKFNHEAKYWLDVSQMERPDHDLQSLIANLSLYQGELLPGFYDEWITLERERIQAVLDARMEQLLEQLTIAERWIAVQEWGERWLTLSGAHEPAFRALMLASGARGDMAKVVSLYQRCSEELKEYLGVEPSAETRALYDGLLKGTKVARAPAQPSGTITFLFTDIEGSTRLLEKMGNQYTVALAEHHEILRAAIKKWNGREMDTQGDAFFVTFTRAIDAVQCAAEAQRGLTSHSWHQGEVLRVRMGLHTGEPLIASTGYVGMDVHRAARIGDAGHGGQILLSQTTRELVIQDLPEGMAIRDLGEHRLKDMKFPTPIYQLTVEGLPADFAPIQTKFTGAEAPTPGEAPFKGLQFFDVDDSDLFFGRETLTSKLVHRLHDANFLSVIIGASGSGKSSLVRAGVVPAIKKGSILINGTKPPDGSANWRVHILTPTAHPLEALAIELTRESESVTAAATLADDLSKDPRSLHFFLSRQAQMRQTQTQDSTHTLLVIDQFEELFTLCRDSFEREAFIDNLLTALTPSPLLPSLDGRGGGGEGNLTLVITLRADFYAHLAQFPELRDAVAQGQEYIGPMTSEELRRAIEEPTRRGHWEFEPGLVDLILRDVGDEPGALPLLSHALLETWKRRAGHVLTLKGYADAGGVRGAIAHTAESLFQNLAPAERTIMRNILLRLTEFGEGTEDTRRRASFDELMSSAEDADDARLVLNKLAEARLVTLSEDQAEVAHEALIREWPQLREWLSQDREGILLHRHLTEAAQEWELLEREAGSVYRGARLAQANEWSALNPNTLNTQERLFLEASNSQMRREEQEREEARQRELAAAKELAETQRQSASRLRIRNRVITTVASVAVILAMLAGLLGLRAENEKQLATSRELAAAAISNLDTDPERSILLALQAESTEHTIEAENALHRSILASRVLLVLHHDGGGFGVAYSPDGKRIATAGKDKTAKIWDANTGKLLMTLTGHTDEVTDINFSPDGRRIATSSLDQKVKIWGSNNGQLLSTLAGHHDGVHGIEFSPDGTRLITASSDKTAIIWEVATGKKLLTFSNFNGTVYDIAFSPDGKRVAACSADGIVRVWDANSGKELLTLPTEDSPFLISVTFSPDGTHIASSGGLQYPYLRVWDAATGKVLLNSDLGHLSAINRIVFSPDGTLAATVSDDQKVKVWDSATGRVLYTFSGPASVIVSAAFSPDGTRLVTSSFDGTARVWDLTPPREVLFIPFADTATSTWTGWLSYSPDGKRILTDYTDGNARIWDAASGRELLQLEGPALYTAYSSDGKLAASGNNENTVIVWDAQTGKRLTTLVGHMTTLVDYKNVTSQVFFSPDGTRLASTTFNGELIVWDLPSGKALFTLQTPGADSGSQAYSPDGMYLVVGYGTAEGGYGVILDANTGQTLFTLPQDGYNSAVAYSPDGKRVALASLFGTVSIWDALTGKQLLTLRGHTSWVYAVAFSPDSKLLATSSIDGTARIWDAASGVNLLTLHVDSGGTGGVSFTPDGKRLAVGGKSGIYIFLLPIEDVIALAKSRVTRSLTTEECQKYLHVEACPVEP